MSGLDYGVLIVSMLAIAAYGIWRTRGRRDLTGYLKGRQVSWFAIGLSVMATQASAITFLSTPGQGYMSGLGFVQIYFGMPIALIIIAAVFLPIYQRLGVYTAYEYLGQRFDTRTRVFGAVLFLLQRGLGAGLTIYAPAIVLTTVFGWPINPTIICSGLLVVVYTVAGGSEAVTVTQKYQLTVIFAAMIAAFCLLICKLPSGITFKDAVVMAGGFQKLKAVNFSTNAHERYTFWSGVLGGTFLMLSYFGADQSQVQRYISGSSVRESRLGLMFNAICKIPMQFCILFLGVLLFVFYQFEPPPLFFNPASNHNTAQMRAYGEQFKDAHAEMRQKLEAWLHARHHGEDAAAGAAFASAASAHERGQQIRAEAAKATQASPKGVSASDADYVFITFIMRELPHGVIGLLVAAFFAAALSAKAAELNALGASTTVDFYRQLIRPEATDASCVLATKCFTALWGLAAICFALYAHLAENLIQAVNILGSIFYGVLLGLFVTAFFLRQVGGVAVFWAALAAQALVCVLYFKLTISYLWFPLIGCGACVLFSLILQAVIGGQGRPQTP